MRSKFSPQIVLSTLVVITLAFLLYSHVRPTKSVSVVPVEEITKIPEDIQVIHGLPVRLTIPKINVNAPIEYVGLTPDGLMDAPKNPSDVAWYNLGTRPGEVGSAVIDGHFGWKNNTPAVFDNLHTLQAGDVIYVEDENGKTISFTVREIRSFDPEADASEVFFSDDGKSHLNLITCEGVWDKAKESFSQRLVVFADRDDQAKL